MPTAERENRDRPTQAAEDRGARKPDDENRDMNTEDDDLPYDVQVAKSYMRDLAEVHKSYSGGMKRMGHPTLKKWMQKSMNMHADQMSGTKEKCEKCYPEHPIHGVDVPAKMEMKKADDEEEEDEDDGDEDGDEGMSDDEKSLVVAQIAELQTMFGALGAEIQANTGA